MICRRHKCAQAPENTDEPCNPAEGMRQARAGRFDSRCHVAEAGVKAPTRSRPDRATARCRTAGPLRTMTQLLLRGPPTPAASAEAHTAFPCRCGRRAGHRACPRVATPLKRPGSLTTKPSRLSYSAAPSASAPTAGSAAFWPRWQVSF